jgi:hypothetical protein
MVWPTSLTVVLNVTTNHTLDLTSQCPPVQTILKPKPSPVLISYHQKQDSEAIVFVKNLLTCLGFLFVWLLSQKLMEKSWQVSGTAKSQYTQNLSRPHCRAPWLLPTPSSLDYLAVRSNCTPVVMLARALRLAAVCTLTRAISFYSRSLLDWERRNRLRSIRS